MKKRLFQILIILTVTSFAASFAGAHCEIPCGIYDDQARIEMLSEHITTLEKSMKMILDLQKNDPSNNNQLVRWIVNKENHANAFQEIVSQYFMTQRIKTDMKDYTRLLTLLHQMLVYAMKCKQTTDLSNIGTLRSILKDFQSLYFGHSH